MTPLYPPFLAHIPEGGRILDAGCGSGRDAKYFLAHGYDVEAFDASPALARLAAEYLSREVRCLTFDEIAPSGDFYGVWACASLLHVPASGMSAALAKLAAALKPEGVLYASFKYGVGETTHDGRRFTCYDDESFTALTDELAGLSIAALWRTSDPRSRREVSWLNVLLVRTP